MLVSLYVLALVVAWKLIRNVKMVDNLKRDSRGSNEVLQAYSLSIVKDWENKW